jgi:hypothetical protein
MGTVFAMLTLTACGGIVPRNYLKNAVWGDGDPDWAKRLREDDDR